MFLLYTIFSGCQHFFIKKYIFLQINKKDLKREASPFRSFEFYSRVREWLTPSFRTVTLDTEPSFPTTISSVAADPSPAERLAW